MEKGTRFAALLLACLLLALTGCGATPENPGTIKDFAQYQRLLEKADADSDQYNWLFQRYMVDPANNTLREEAQATAMDGDAELLDRMDALRLLLQIEGAPVSAGEVLYTGLPDSLAPYAVAVLEAMDPAVNPDIWNSTTWPSRLRKRDLTGTTLWQAMAVALPQEEELFARLAQPAMKASTTTDGKALSCEVLAYLFAEDMQRFGRMVPILAQNEFFALKEAEETTAAVLHSLLDAATGTEETLRLLYEMDEYLLQPLNAAMEDAYALLEGYAIPLESSDFSPEPHPMADEDPEALWYEYRRADDDPFAATLPATPERLLLLVRSGDSWDDLPLPYAAYIPADAMLALRSESRAASLDEADYVLLVDITYTEGAEYRNFSGGIQGSSVTVGTLGDDSGVIGMEAWMTTSLYTPGGSWLAMLEYDEKNSPTSISYTANDIPAHIYPALPTAQELKQLADEVYRLPVEAPDGEEEAA